MGIECLSKGVSSIDSACVCYDESSKKKSKCVNFNLYLGYLMWARTMRTWVPYVGAHNAQ